MYNFVTRTNRGGEKKRERKEKKKKKKRKEEKKRREGGEKKKKRRKEKKTAIQPGTPFTRLRASNAYEPSGKVFNLCLPHILCSADEFDR